MADPFEPLFIFLERLQGFLPVIVMPIVVIGIWALIFYNGNPVLTQIVIQMGYIFFAIPLIVGIFLSIPILMFTLALADTQWNNAFANFLFISFFVGTFITQYFYIKRKVGEIEEREALPIWQVIRREFDRDYRRQQKIQRQQTVTENKDFFSQITDLNKEKRQKEKEDREKLRRVLTRAEEPRSEPNSE